MRLVKSLIDRCFDLITLLSENASGLSLGEISRRLDVPKSAAHRLLTNLCELGWAEQVPDSGYYRLSLRLAVVGQRLLAGTKIPDICQPILDRLADTTKGLGRIAIIDPDGLTWIAHSQGVRSGLIYQPELVAKVPLHTTANGKAWLATLDRDEALARAVASGLGRTDIGGPRAITTKQTFSAALDETQEQGWASAIEEAEPGVAAIAAVIKVSGQVVGTVSVAGPIHRFSPVVVPEVAEQVKAAAQELSELWPYRVTLPGHQAPIATVAKGMEKTV
ncbi:MULTISPECIES: IclR family transcriptional regulator [Agrobacterium]|uniref:IclR family transcriptional regulator n=1 Tax=Agrobacterium salinitolerans TaxID=1183413 RepID=A0A9X3R115_9HYPH|nr:MULTISPECIES: IclR family transcriptional regulator [Agrobacterium]MCZ7939892.1 IclR family transcriptional regulator [Agrobacterium salinitolerans]NTD87706.1 IclR family transcriptional regulator [Agrobacterium tumefaciens]NTD91581.1 IclR family transcriptional regulator [Agrobacterium tumefaciens]NTD95566.1 IclR family transcriptional regulator [Agrobacterium tumefaciens]NTE11676.1 IclR family transcriptional regulator [Agrobacterium tumefaciens]